MIDRDFKEFLQKKVDAIEKKELDLEEIRSRDSKNFVFKENLMQLTFVIVSFFVIFFFSSIYEKHSNIFLSKNIEVCNEKYSIEDQVEKAFSGIVFLSEHFREGGKLP